MKKADLTLRGCGTALVTPFNENGTDYTAYAELVKRQVKAGVDFLVPLGTTAETPCLDNDEKAAILELTKELCGNLPVVAGAGTNSTSATAKNVEFLEKHGADAFLIVTPYYNKPTQEGLYLHFRQIAESTDKPVILYNVPGRTGVNLSAETTLRLAEIPNILAIKEASGNYAQISSIIRNAPEGFSVLSGNDDEVLSLMSTGASGVISVASNIAPEMMADMTHLLLEGRIEEARKIHFALMPLFKNCFIESNPIPVKAGLAAMGLIENRLRLPLTPATEKTFSIMTDTVKNLGLL